MNSIAFAGRPIARTGFDPPVTRNAASRGLAWNARAAHARVVAFADSSPEAMNAVWRAALVARDRGLPLHLIAVSSLETNLVAAAKRGESLAEELRGKLNLQVTSQFIAGTRDHEGAQAARDAALVVLPPPGEFWPAGSPVLRMLRLAGGPVLLARSPATQTYQRVLAAVKLDLQASSLVAAAQALSGGARTEVLHVLQTMHEETLRLADVPESVIRAQRERDALRTRGVLEDLIASAGASGAAEPIVRFGNATRAVIDMQVAAGADLVVLGKKPRSALVDAIRGSVTQQMLRGTGADTLVLPMPRLRHGQSWPVPSIAGTPGE